MSRAPDGQDSASRALLDEILDRTNAACVVLILVDQQGRVCYRAAASDPDFSQAVPEILDAAADAVRASRAPGGRH